MASGILTISGQASLISSYVKTNLLLFRASSDNLERQVIEIVAACHDYLSGNSGKDLVFLFDGFDEVSVEIQKNTV